MRGFAFAAACVLTLTAGPVGAQLPHASAATLDKGYDVTALGGGFAAIASNPAGLAHRDAPGFSLVIPAASAQGGLGPVTIGDLADLDSDLLVPNPIKDDWMARVVSSDGQMGRIGAGATPLAFTAGPVGIQVSSRGGGSVELNPDAVELLLYGNAGRTGNPGDFDLDGAHMESFAVSTAAVSLGIRATDRLLLGVTGKYSVGNGLMVARDGGSFVSSDPIAVDLDFPVLIPYKDEFKFDNGTGLGIDLGAIWEGPITFGVMMENVFNTFEWKLDDFQYVPGQAVFDDVERESEFEEQPLSDAPAELRADFEALAEEFKLERRLAVGASMPVYPTLVVFGNVQKSLTDGMSFDPDFYGGVGLEWSLLSFLPLRAHGAAITDGYEVGGGLSLVLGPVHLSGGAGYRTESTHDSVLLTFALSFGSR